MPCKIMWVELKDNFLDHQPNRIFVAVSGRNPGKFFFLVFVNSAFQIYMPFFVDFAEVFLLPFLKTTCVTFSVAGFLMPLSLASERNSAAKMRTAKSVSASEI